MAAADRVSALARVVPLAPLRAGREADGGTDLPGGEARTRPLVEHLEELVVHLRAHGPRPDLRRCLDQALGAWAGALIATHRTRVTALTPDAPLPWVLTDDPVPAWLDDLPTVAGPVWAVRQHPGVQRALEAARHTWSAVQLVHGDCTGDHVLVPLEGDGEGRLARLTPGTDDLGVGTGGCGDPRWDLATALDWLATTLSPALDPTWDLDPVAGLTRVYRERGGDALPSRALAVARTVATAVEWSACVLDGADADEDDLAWLAGLWTRPLELVGSARPPVR